ncbi:putative transposase [Caldicellulosiruptor bescii]|uniref:Transposase n=2 Tax=Caldicellulosiruptor bescii TaxID=31899 RepID=B9MP15_CALBD|nr:RNA-guided endonuclease TnpB family protein [Caldicellulosiruptor bescii]ACM61574.1 transposase [Caldicellulosiruptor bescii DSM 6725]PBC88616.1 putative transposase [Caldicellulosiruptor bescii]PBC91903.1 putative transposase [Caldicellulosiruptor bescii]PBD02686.1 putative transposase [Caldicellulosiruptor bescii]PBD07698.1 putative transposase [Caldicellulosiruptor bescii]
MKLTLSCKFKLWLSQEQKRKLIETAKTYTSAINFVLAENLKDKTTNVKKLHKLYYKTIRKKFSLPSQLAINVYRQVADIYQTLWAQYNNLLYREQNSNNNSGTAEEFWSKPPKRKTLTVNYTHGRTFSIKYDKNTDTFFVSISSIHGRIKNVRITGWKQHYNYLKHGEIGDPVLVYDKPSKEFYLHIPVTLEIDEKLHKEIAGIDVGERNIVTVVSTAGARYTIPLPDQVRRTKRHYHELRSQLMSKGTRSARRKLQKIGMSEKRFVSNFLHKLTKDLVRKHPAALFVMEDLSMIRTNRITYRGNDSEARRQAEQWPFAELQNKLEYKSILYNGICSVKVDPSYTSLSCPVCGHVSKDNRPGHGELFKCQRCGYEENADIVGATNIAIRYLVEVQQMNLRGLLVNQPNVPCLQKQVEQAPTSIGRSS